MIRSGWKLVAASLVCSLGFGALGGAPQGEAYVAVVGGKETPMPAIGEGLGDPYTVQRILDEGIHRNQVMEHLRYLSEQIGPRLTGSTRGQRANEWVRDQFMIWGLHNPRLEQWGEIPVGFDRGPSTGKVLLRREVRAGDRRPSEGAPGPRRRPRPQGTAEEGSAPEATPASGEAPKDEPKKDDVKIEYEELRAMEFTTPAWTMGTNGPVRGRAIKEPQTEEEYQAVKDQLKGAWIVVQARSPVAQRGVRSEVSSRIRMRDDAIRAMADGTKKLEDMTLQERLAVSGAAGFISASRDERVWTGQLNGWRELTLDTVPKSIEVVVRRGDYDFINSRLFDKEPIELEFNLDHKLFTGPEGAKVPTYNVIAEIPGTTWPDQVIILSAHIDSWDGPGSQGTTDNGTGTSVMMEAARILMAAGAQPKRTIKIILWTGEEQGLLGSRGYVEKHRGKMDSVSAVFVDDGGTNYQGGLHCIPEMADILAAATAPVNNKFFDGVTGKPLNVNIQVEEKMPQGGGSDHASFNAIGVPGFYWDEVGRAEYTYGWHTQHDKFNLAIPEYLKQSATCSAVTAYRLACADSLLPREPKKEDKKDEKAEVPKSSAAEQKGS